MINSGMVEGVGCCSICARVCHRDHDVTYSKHGSFFCDCGARDDGSCGALTVRNCGGEDNRRRAPLTYAVDSQLLSSSPRKEEREEREPITAHQLDLARQIDGVCNPNSFSIIHSCVTGERCPARAGDLLKLAT